MAWRAVVWVKLFCVIAYTVPITTLLPTSYFIYYAFNLAWNLCKKANTKIHKNKWVLICLICLHNNNLTLQNLSIYSVISNIPYILGALLGEVLQKLPRPLEKCMNISKAELHMSKHLCDLNFSGRKSWSSFCNKAKSVEQQEQRKHEGCHFI